MTETLASKRSISSINVMLTLGQEQGLSIEQCLANTGVDAAALNDSDAMVTGAQELQVIDNLVRALPKAKGLGLQAGMRYQLTTFGIWAFAIISSPTIRAAIELALRYVDLSFVLVKFSLVEKGERVEVTMDIDHIPRHLHQFVVERHLAILLLFAREMMGSNFPKPQQVHFSIDAWPVPQLPDWFDDADVKFAAEKNVFVLDKAALELASPKANSATAKFCAQQCQELLDAQQAQTGFAGEVRQFLLSDLANTPPVAKVAEHFHISVRTFHRRLDEQGASYRQLVDELRSTVAIELLNTAQLNVESVADRLGYAETASFIHAFKRWTGKTPGQYRKEQLSV